MPNPERRTFQAKHDESPRVETTEYPAPLSPFEAKQAIHEYLLNGYVIPTTHCRKRMEKRDISMQDIEYVLRHGAVIEQPRWNAEHQNYVYKVEGFDLESDELKVLSVIIESESAVLIVTVF